MSKVSATYNAPEDDSAVVTMGGVRFFDGQAQKLDAVDHALLLSKLHTNQHFTVKGGEEKQVSTDASLKAVHRGGARFSIMQGDTVVKEGLNKEDAAAFNALNDDDKAEYVK